MTISNYAELRILDAILNNASLAIAAVYVQLHTADPTDAGTTAVAGETDRVVATFAAAASGQCVSDADIQWVSVAATETYHSVSLWDASTSGNCLWTGPLTVPKAVTAGDTFTIPSGQLTVSLD